ncbi:MAG: glycosyltransferase family 4 protein [Pseudomonadota bacterium]
MSVIAAFSKYLAYEVGGAEVSTRELLATEARRGNEVILVSIPSARFLGAPMREVPLEEGWLRVDLQAVTQLARFPFTEYLLNRARVRGWFSRLVVDELWTYGLWAPAAMLGFSGRVRYFIRSESDLGIASNYQRGFRRGFRAAYGFSEWPARSVYLSDLRRTVKNAVVVANSMHMANRARECLGVDAEVWYPSVDVALIRAKLDARQSNPRWVVFVGDSPIKGLGLVLGLAQRLPELEFRIFSRFVREEHVEGNVLWSPWQSDPWRIYEDASLVIVPSQCEEGYGRVSREAYLLGLPLLVSKIGGLPESVDGAAECLIAEYSNADAWHDAIRRKMGA